MIRRPTRLFLVACEHLIESFYDDKYISATELSQRYNINPRALRPALVVLTRCGVLNSQTGGKEPGFRFTRDPREISVYDILLHLEGEQVNICCTDTIIGLQCSCKEKFHCAFYIVNDKLINNYQKLFSRVPLIELFGYDQTNLTI